jgi:two-component system OmpR family response regulator/two-component system response regulator QseB
MRVDKITSMRVLVIEDDEGLAHGVMLMLRQQHWAPDVAPSTAKAWAALRKEAFGIVLLDLDLADGKGEKLLQRLREAPPGALPDPSTPVLAMTASDDMSTRVAILDMGADDHMVKPFDRDELAARMRALRRRAAGRAQAMLRWGDFEVDPAARRVSRSGKEVELSVREFGVLITLLEASPRVLSREQLETNLYSWGRLVDSNAIEVYVHHLRKKLGDGVIRTLRGVGYFVPRDSA